MHRAERIGDGAFCSSVQPIQGSLLVKGNFCLSFFFRVFFLLLRHWPVCGWLGLAFRVLAQTTLAPVYNRVPWLPWVTQGRDGYNLTLQKTHANSSRTSPTGRKRHTTTCVACRLQVSRDETPKGTRVRYYMPYYGMSPYNSLLHVRIYPC